MKKSVTSLGEEEVQKQKELRKEEERKKKQEKKKEYEEAAKRRAKQYSAAEEAALKLGKKHSEWFLNPYYLTFGALGVLLIYIVVMLFMNRQPPLNKIPVLDETKFFEHNSASEWEQGASKFWEGATLADAKKLMSNGFASHSNINRCLIDTVQNLPESFDLRTQNAECKLPVADQNKKCTGAYALTVTSAFAERKCLESEDKKLTKLSAQELLSCDTANKGCRGGYLNNALEYLVVRGVSTEDCLPYKGTYDAKCSDMCADPIKERAEAFCILFGENDIKSEIMTHGPVVATMEVYVDFLTYKTGVYRKGEDVPKFSGLHSIKIVGWGVESGEGNEKETGNKYWIIENSWGEDWGENGYAKISAGQEFMFEQYAYSVLTKKQVEEMKKNMEKKQKEKEQTPPPSADTTDMNLDDDDVNKN